MQEFELTANIRRETGSRASRRMRRAGSIPAVLYGAKKEPVWLSVDARNLKKKLENEAFGSSILSLEVENKKEPVILKALQRHPVSSRVTHLDFLRISETQQIQLRIPLHFINEDTSPAKKMGAVISHLITEVDVSCLPRNLPEAIPVDMSEMEIGQNIHLSDLKMPDGAALTVLSHGTDQAVANAAMPRGAEETSETEEAEGAEGAAEEGEQEKQSP
uniref:Large ribosomal subunit protein bL25 n=1 Tax=Candidatus Kentrum sp. DK TaxID=2126562 RepID=A0A450SXG3_9GAMM|nr:MAG: LSU ribosomal protein L25P [Candidatus Kentron sp. DK]VFJ58781.1 MAG: LSU ribosomal protein L25P [Candidatus Kentron sp. DK]